MSDKKREKGKAAKFFEEKGFYLVLLLCVIAVGTAGYVFLSSGIQSEEPDTDLIGATGADFTALPAISLPTTTVTAQALEGVGDEKQVGQDETDEPAQPAAKTRGLTSDDITGNTSKSSKQTTKKPAPVADSYVKPVEGKILNGFSGEELVYNRTTLDWRTHNGVDFAVAEGEKVRSIAAGVIEDIYSDSYYGTSVLIDHGNGIKSVYTCLEDSINAAAGQTVAAGTELGEVNDDVLFECAEERHVHIEVLENGVRTDPMKIIPS